MLIMLHVFITRLKINEIYFLSEVSKWPGTYGKCKIR